MIQSHPTITPKTATQPAEDHHMQQLDIMSLANMDCIYAGPGNYIATPIPSAMMKAEDDVARGSRTEKKRHLINCRLNPWTIRNPIQRGGTAVSTAPSKSCSPSRPTTKKGNIR